MLKAGEDPIFARMSLLESLRTIISLAATDFHGVAKKNRDPKSPDRIQVSFMDISRAYFCAAKDPDDPTYFELPPEDPDHGILVGRLRNHMCGMRKAADGWHCEYAGRLANNLGFAVGDASACVFFNAEREFSCSVRGDDVTIVGCKANHDWFKAELEKYFGLKEAHRLGPGPEDHKEAVVLNRVVRWIRDGLEYEADPRQGEKLLRDFQLDGDGVKEAETPGVKATREELDADVRLEPAKHAVPSRGRQGQLFGFRQAGAPVWSQEGVPADVLSHGPGTKGFEAFGTPHGEPSPTGLSVPVADCQPDRRLQRY